MSTTISYKDFRSFNAKEYIDSRTAMVAPSIKTTVTSPSLASRQPKPLIKSFESALDDLLRLRRKVQAKIDDLEDAAQASENARRRKLTEMNSAVEDVQSAFKSLELHLGEVGKTAVRIGEQLETIDKQRRIAAEAKDLIYYFQDFNRKRVGGEALDGFRKTGADQEAQTASIVRRLNAISKDLGIPGTETAKDNIEGFSEELETTILDQFHSAYVKGDLVVMSRCARVLTDLNGGQSCVRTYINQHELNINQDKISAADGLGVEAIDKNGPAVLNPKLKKLFDDVKRTIPQEWGVISAVFPNSVSVMQDFVQRIFGQSIQMYIEQELSDADQVSSTYYLRVLSVVHEATLSVCKHLYKFDKDVIVPETKSMGIGSVIDRCFDDLFVPYTDNDRYVAIERRCLQDRMAELLHVFTNFATARAKAPKAKSSMPLPSFQEAVGTIFNLDPTSPAASKSNGSLLNSNEPPEAFGLPSVALTLKLIEVHLEALERCKELSKLGDLARNVLAVFRVLIEEVGQKYLIHALDMVLDDIMGMDGRASEPELRGLEVVRVENQVLNLLQFHFQTAIFPLLNQSPTIHRDSVLSKNEFMETIETKMNSIIKIHVDAIQEWLELLLSKQRRGDYKPKDEQTASSPSTATCVQVCEFLSKVHVKAEKYFEGTNLSGFLNEIGSIFHMLLLEHMKKFTFSDVGGLILARDLAKYFEVVQTFRIEQLTDKFEMIRELGNLFIVKPDNLQQVINGGHLSRIDITLLTPFLMCRVDWNKLQKLGIFFAPTSI
ncbi:Exocyst complex component 5 [Rhizoclosmatium sp. JEL0117]|nr:Exocyst complex component 5 [Rhizoclosmatium sp. JEL0117]